MDDECPRGIESSSDVVLDIYIDITNYSSKPYSIANGTLAEWLYNTPTVDTGYSRSSFYSSITLSIPDTDDTALARVTPTVGTSTSSILETRSTGFTFTKRTVDYAILCTGLVDGVAYEGEIPLQKREAVIGTTDTWEALTSATFSFTASAAFHVVGGTLNAGITDQEFIDADYSLDPTDYGLAADADVIIPSTALDHVQGREYQVGTNPDSDPLYVERSA